MKREFDRPDVHNRSHRYELALQNLENDPSICDENKKRIVDYIAYCRATNLSVDRQLLILLKLTVLARLFQVPFEGAARESIVGLMYRVKKRGLAE